MRLLDTMTFKQKQVCALLLEGAGVNLGASTLGISISTFKQHTGYVLHKHGVKNTRELMAKYIVYYKHQAHDLQTDNLGLPRLPATQLINK